MIQQNHLIPQQISAFACKYINFFENVFGTTAESYYQFFESLEFDQECVSMGFKMDCGHAFINLYGQDAFNSYDELRKVIDQIDDINIVGSGLFSRWRYYNHWSYNHADDSVKLWFLLLFRRLLELSHSLSNSDKSHQ